MGQVHKDSTLRAQAALGGCSLRSRCGPDSILAMAAQNEFAAGDKFYYLRNFRCVIDSIADRYADLLGAADRQFISDFRALPPLSQALLVRMVMRTRILFRSADLQYEEISDLSGALLPLINLGWVDDQPALSLQELFKVLNKAEVLQALSVPGLHARMTKASILQVCVGVHSEVQSLEHWCKGSVERIFRLCVAGICERFRAVYFGNFRQTWSEFVLADLGIYSYERFDSVAGVRPFNTAEQIDRFLKIFQCRRLLEEGAALDTIMQMMPARIEDSEWLECRRQKLLFRVARAQERAGNAAAAAELYSLCLHPGSAERAARLQLGRACRAPRRRNQAAVPTFELSMVRPEMPYSVECMARDALANDGGGGSSVHYVENLLINSLFGLLCWRAVFAPIPGAFFHSFHREPVDLSDAGFYPRRRREFDDCFAEFQRGTYKTTIRRVYAEKWGRASPFVAWRGLGADLLELALECLPAQHLERWFERIAVDVPANRAGFPDLIQLWPAERRYRMIEVKAPGDRLQDNQRRCLEFCMSQQMPVSVCRVRWLPDHAVGMTAPRILSAS